MKVKISTLVLSLRSRFLKQQALVARMLASKKLKEDEKPTAFYEGALYALDTLLSENDKTFREIESLSWKLYIRGVLSGAAAVLIVLLIINFLF